MVSLACLFKKPHVNLKREVSLEWWGRSRKRGVQVRIYGEMVKKVSSPRLLVAGHEEQFLEMKKKVELG